MDTRILEAHKLVQAICDNVEGVIIGKRHAIELALIAFLSQGHLLIEDSPGVGKTMLARSLARSFGTKFQRIQFTQDLLPSDITGVSIYNQEAGSFEFHPGPVLANIVLADEINRATPKTQSALLECMEELQITVDGTTYNMPCPFHIIATLNPLEYEGTFPLPETQLDRFLIRLNLGYPSIVNEITIMEKQRFRHPIEDLKQVADEKDLTLIQNAVKTIYVDKLVKLYIAYVVEATRHHPAIHLGASPRGSLALFRTSQARALIEGRDFVLPDDIKALAEPVLAHRLIVNVSNNGYYAKGRIIMEELLEKVPVPGTMPKKAANTDIITHSDVATGYCHRSSDFPPDENFKSAGTEFRVALNKYLPRLKKILIPLILVLIMTLIWLGYSSSAPLSPASTSPTAAISAQPPASLTAQSPLSFAPSTTTAASQTTVIKRYSLTVNVSPSGGGQVTVRPQKSSYMASARVILEAIPNNGCYFESWGGITGAPNTSIVGITMNQDYNILVNFYKPELTMSGPKFVVGDVVKMEGEVYTIEGVDAAELRYNLGKGIYPNDTLEPNLVSSTLVDSVASLIGHVEFSEYDVITRTK